MRLVVKSIMFRRWPLGHWDSMEKKGKDRIKKTVTLSGSGCQVPFLFIYYCSISSSKQGLEVGHGSMFLISRHMPSTRINILMLPSLEKKWRWTDSSWQKTKTKLSSCANSLHMQHLSNRVEFFNKSFSFVPVIGSLLQYFFNSQELRGYPANFWIL